MVIGKKKRDVKFIIYQSLYILVIAMLGAKHVTINDIPDALIQGDTIVQITKLDSLDRLVDSLKMLPKFDPETQVALNKPEKDSTIKILSINETIITIKQLEDLKRGQVKSPPPRQDREKTPTQEPGTYIPTQP